MTTRRKLLLASLGAAVVVLGAPVAWSAFSTHAYFRAGRCVCGNDAFVRIQGDGYFKYSPGHRVPEHRAFTLRAQGDGWELMGHSHSDLYTSPLEGENKVIARIRLRDGALYESWGTSTNWTRLPRVHNIWRVWWARLLEQ